MFCPNYKNKQVFDGFNEMIEAFGGRPMTEEEFRSPELRRARSGADYSAMEAAYITYDRNGGYFLDETPQGKPSLLFLTLLSHFNGDKAKAIVAKSNVYSDEFFNWFGGWLFLNQDIDLQTKDQVSLIFKRIPQLSEIGTEEQYAQYIQTIFPNSQDKSVYWHGSDSDFSRGFKSAKRGEGSGAPETKERKDFYLAKQAWSVLLYVSGVNRKSVDKNGFSIWNKLWFEFKEIMANGRRENNDWKNIVINENTVRQAIPNKKGIFDRDQGKGHGKWLKERKADYGYENKSDKEFFEEILGVKWGVDTFNTWTQRNAEIFKSLLETEKGIYPAVINTVNPIQEKGQDTYYEEHRGLFTKADADGNDAILGSETDNEFGSDVAVVLRNNNNVHFLGTQEDMDAFSKFVNRQNVSKVVDENGEPLVVWHGTTRTFKLFKLNKKPRHDLDTSGGAFGKGFYFTQYKKSAIMYAGSSKRQKLYPVYLNMKNPYSGDMEYADLFGKYNSIEDLKDDIIRSSAPDDDILAVNDALNSIDYGNYNIADGVIADVPEDDEFPADIEYVVLKSNQIKHVENLGTWNPKTNNIYHLKKDMSFDEDHEYFKAADIVSSFGQELSQQLMNGETVSSRDLMKAMLNNGIFHSLDNKLARALSLHDVPVRIGYSMKNGEFAKTVTDGEASVIYINPNELSQVSKGYAGVTIMHELVHSITVDIIDHPRTQADFEFVNANKSVFDKITSNIKHLDVYSRDVVDGLYALSNEKEFAACFASDPIVRALMCGLAEKIDRLNKKSGILSQLKKIVNVITKAFSKRAMFKEDSLIKEVSEYEQILKDYLTGAPVIERGNTSKSKLKQVYAKADKAILNHEDFIESMKMLEKMSELQKNYLTRGDVQSVNINDVELMLKTRVQALKKSVLDSVEKGKLISTTENQLEMFVIDEAGKYDAVSNLLRTSVPLMIDTVDQLRAIRRENGKFTNADYMYQMHANIGMYNEAYNTIQEWLVSDVNKQRMVDLYNQNNPTKITVDDIKALELNLKNAKSFSEEAIHILDYMLKENGIDTLKKIAAKVGYKDIDKYIETLNTEDANLFAEDISALELLGGASDASANDAVRALSFIINKALLTALFKTTDRETDLLQLQKNLQKGEKGWHLYETDENGNFTGYLIRDLNFGRFRRDYNDMIKSLNQDLINLFGLATLGLDNRVAPDGEAGKREATIRTKINGTTVEKTYTAKQYFEEKKDEWLNKHCERMYKPEYYEHYSKLPQRVKDQLGAIKTQIQAITSNYKDLYDENGVPHYEQLSDEDWIKLNTLWERRKFMRSPINEYGFLREGQDYEDAKALADLYETLYGMANPFKNEKQDFKKRDKKHYKKEWLAARNAVIAKYGENSEQLEKWDERNSKKTLKRNEFDEVLVFLEIEKEFGDFELDWGEEYQRLKDQKNEILNKYRMLNGEVDANSIPQVLINALVEIEHQMMIERNRQKSTQTNADKSRVAKFKEIWDKYIKYVDTTQLKKAKEDARAEARRRLAQDEDPFGDTTEDELMNIILGNTYGYISFDDDLLDTAGTFVPYSWLQRMESVDPQYMDIEPNDAWIDKLDSELLNKDFDQSYGVSFVPKRSLYDNEAAYSKIFGKKNSDGTRSGGSKTLQALYKGILDTMHEANGLLQREYADDYLLPLMECTAMERLARKSTWKGFKNWLRKVTGFGRILGLSDDPNDTDINQAVVESSEGRVETSISGVYPDGRDFHVIPTPFTRQLEHPELISKNIVGITRDYYLMANKYHERSLVRDDCELILDLLKKQKFKESNKFGKTRNKIVKLTGGNQKESNVVNFAKKLIERDLYDIQREPVKFLGIDWSKVLSLIKRLTTARNLGMNPKVALVGFFTTMFTHTINGLVGYKYSSGDMFNAGIIAMNEFGSNFAGLRFIGDRLTKNKLILLLEMLDMSDLSGRKSEHSNRNRILQALYKNSTFGLMSACDIYSKATIAVATLLSYRYVDGQFMTKHMIEEKRLTVGEDEYKRLMKEFKKSKVNAYNIFEGDSKAWKAKINSNDTKLHVKEEYRAAWEKVKMTAANKALKNAEQADGMATRLQKAMMTRNFLGAFVLIHRQYIPLMLQLTWGKRVYDFDAEEYKGGQFRTLFNYVRNVACASALSSIGAGAFVGLAFGGFAPVPIIACSTGALVYSLQHKIRHRGDKKSIKDVNKEFFGTGLGSVLNPFGTKFSSIKEGQNLVDHDNEIANAYQIRQTFYEVMLINFMIAPVANFLSAAADNVDKDDDKWKWLLLQSLAYWARATQFETNSKYNLIDILNNVKSATAATAVTDSYLAGLSTFGTGMVSSLFFSTLGFGRNYTSQSIVADIHQTAVNFFIEDENELETNEEGLIENGTYVGHTEFFRDFMKATPFHNIVEQWINPAAKKRYHETQVMKLTPFERQSWLYDWIYGSDEYETNE